jgi:hypothetical protein
VWKEPLGRPRYRLKIILKSIVEKCDLRMWNGFTQIKITTGGGPLCRQYATSNSIKDGNFLTS